MPRRVLLVTVLALTMLVALPLSASMEGDPYFQLGFETLAEMIPEIAGTPLENEHHNPLNGDGLQATTTGLMVWRKADNWTAFTNGYWTWVNGPYGLQDRSNLVRFEREADAPRILEIPLESTVVSSTTTPEPVQPSTDSWLSTVPATATASSFWPTETATSSPIPTWEPSATPYVEATSTTRPTAVPTSTRVPTAVPTVAPSRTPVPTAVPTSTPQPTATRVPTSTPTVRPTATQVPAGIRSPDPAGDWVTSVSSSTVYYCSKDSSYWKTWSSANRIWFATEAALLSAYPGRVRHD